MKFDLRSCGAALPVRPATFQLPQLPKRHRRVTVKPSSPRRMAQRAMLALIPWFVPLPVYGEVPADAIAAQQARADAMARASAATVAIFEASGGGGGSGVLISPDGFALTNFHVVQPCGPAMACGLPDGNLYDGVLVGVDPVGDVALIQLLGRDDFPVAEIGDSDEVRVGDWCFAAGNPFLLADDFRPSISYGIVSGVHRYQYPAKTLLEYADCIQTDAAINPGNSGGPLFNSQGRLIGVNGRGSFEKRGRVNVGVGYAISINQIMRFLGHLKSGRIVDHASLGATVATQDGVPIVDDILENSDVYRRGLRYNDVIFMLADRDVTSANALKNVLGVYPPGWRVTLGYRRNADLHQTEVRLMHLHAGSELVDLVQQIDSELTPDGPDPSQPPPDGDAPPEPGPDEQQGPQSPRRPGRRAPAPADHDEIPQAVAQRYEPRRGYANYWYNARMQRQLWDAYVEPGRLADIGYHWNVSGTLADGVSYALNTTQEEGSIRLAQGESRALFTEPLIDQLSPPQSGGLLAAIHLWQRFLDKGLRQFGECYYLGQMTAGPGRQPCECLVGIADGMEMHFLFDPTSGDLASIELFSDDEADPCEIWFRDFQQLSGRRLPTRWLVRNGDRIVADMRIDEWTSEAWELDKEDDESSETRVQTEEAP